MTTFHFNIDADKIKLGSLFISPEKIKTTPEIFFKEYSGILKEGVSGRFDPDFITRKLLDLTEKHPHMADLFDLPTKFLGIRDQIVRPAVIAHNKRTLSIRLAGQSNNLSFGNKLAEAAKNVATNMNSKGKCYRGVKSALLQMGINLHGYAAYQAKDQLLNNSNFKTADIPVEELGKLPAGSIVVWDKSPQKPYGHISIALGNGQEASDHIQNQITNGSKYGGYTVFIPK